MSAAVAAAAAAALANRRNSTTASATTASATTASAKYTYNSYTNLHHHPLSLSPQPRLSRYELQKRQDWDTFGQYLKSHHRHHPPVSMLRCSGDHVVEFLRYLDQFGETKVHNHSCRFFGQAYAPAACPCPLKQAWSSLDAMVGRLRASFEEHGGSPKTNPFGSPAVLLYLREVEEFQAKARGIANG